MRIATENDITPAAAKWLREQAAMTQADFWRSVLSTAGSGCRYEQGDTLPPMLRRLIFLAYVAKLPIDASTVDGAQQTLVAGEEYQTALAGGRVGISTILNDVAVHLKKASRALGI